MLNKALLALGYALAADQAIVKAAADPHAPDAALRLKRASELAASALAGPSDDAREAFLACGYRLPCGLKDFRRPF